VGEPSSFLTGLDDLLPRRGRALDVAGGLGRHALWLATRGLDVTVTDVSDTGLALARGEAERRGVSITTDLRDLESDGLPAGPWDLIVCFHYLHRPLFPKMIAGLSPDGLLVCEIATVRNLERHDRPPRAYLLEEDELRRLTEPLAAVIHTEGWVDDDRHWGRSVGRRSAPVDGDHL
jgi:tellurite methyltransferase